METQLFGKSPALPVDGFNAYIYLRPYFTSISERKQTKCVPCPIYSFLKPIRTIRQLGWRPEAKGLLQRRRYIGKVGNGIGFSLYQRFELGKEGPVGFFFGRGGDVERVGHN
jgi:hypothetical protein